MDIVKTGRFFAGLSLTGWLSILGASVLLMAGVYIHDLRETIRRMENEKKDKDMIIHNITDRYNNDIISLRREVEACNKMRIDDQKVSNDYWRDRVHILEERAAKSFREIKEK